MIDIHTHILPGLDDGAEDLEESLAMARLALADGVTALIATPHVIRGSFFPSRREILEAVSLLNERLAEQGLPLRILPGAEYRLEPDLPERLAKGELVTLNDAGRYLLLELPSTFVPPYAERVLYELQLQGVTPILAHPERNAELCRRPELLVSLAERGILFQITAGSVTGVFGSLARRVAFRLAEQGRAHFLASDAHSPRGRPPVLSPALEELGRSLGRELAGQLLANAQSVVAGRPLMPAAPGVVGTAVTVPSGRPSGNGLKRVVCTGVTRQVRAPAVKASPTP